ncbi:hypothetical protein ACU4GI_33005 [Cupriavidus basilensis]
MKSSHRLLLTCVGFCAILVLVGQTLSQFGGASGGSRPSLLAGSAVWIAAAALLLLPLAIWRARKHFRAAPVALDVAAPEPLPPIDTPQLFVLPGRAAYQWNPDGSIWYLPGNGRYQVLTGQPLADAINYIHQIRHLSAECAQ